MTRGERIKQRRKELGLSQRELADQLQLAGLDIDKNALDRLTEIAKKYGTDVNTLLDYINTDRQINYFKSIKK